MKLLKKHLDMNKAPKDRAILLKINDIWIQAEWIDDKNHPECSCWYREQLSSHGCGCCAGGDPDPTAWFELPK